MVNKLQRNPSTEKISRPKSSNETVNYSTYSITNENSSKAHNQSTLNNSKYFIN